MESIRLICRVRESRRRAIAAASNEMLALLEDLGASAAPGGPLADRPGVFWVDLPEDSLAVALGRMPLLGYTSAIGVLDPMPRGFHTSEEIVQYQGGRFRLRELFRSDEERIEREAPDQREFLLEDGVGTTRIVRGYRGSSAAGTRRGLPACDARLLVNLVNGGDRKGEFLDPFAGAGSIVAHAIQSGFRVRSADLDPRVAPGLVHLGSSHAVADARALPFESERFDAVATEPPYDPDLGLAARAALPELCRVLTPGGRVALLCARWQTAGIRDAAESLPLETRVDTPIDRKGLACDLLCWVRTWARSEG